MKRFPSLLSPWRGNFTATCSKCTPRGDSNPPTPWLSGTWDLEINEDGTPGALTITAAWQDGENITKLSDAQSGVAKTYSLNEEGVYEISVDFPSASGLTFKLDPGADKVTAAQ